MSNIQHNVVYKTYDYSQFKTMKGNRNISLSHLSTIKESLTKKQLEIPIIINDKNEVFEGQHRLAACKQLNYPVYFIKCPNLTLDDAITINAISRKWTSLDYLDHHIAQGNETYKVLKNFMNLTGTNVQLARVFLQKKSIKNQPGYREFIKGTLELCDFEEGMRYFSLHNDYKICPAFKKMHFKMAVAKLLRHPEYDHERMVRKLNNYAYRITNRANMSDYVEALTEIYNEQQKKSTHVYFNIEGV